MLKSYQPTLLLHYYGKTHNFTWIVKKILLCYITTHTSGQNDNNYMKTEYCLCNLNWHCFPFKRTCIMHNSLRQVLMGIVHIMHLYLVLLVFKKQQNEWKVGGGYKCLCFVLSSMPTLGKVFFTLVVSIEKKSFMFS